MSTIKESTRLTYNCAHLRSTKDSLTIEYVRIIKKIGVKILWVKIFLVKIFWVNIFWVKIVFGEYFLGENFLGENFFAKKWNKIEADFGLWVRCQND